MFVKVSTDFVNWSVEKGEQRKGLVVQSSMKRYCSFSIEKCPISAPKMTKNPKFSNFQSFLSICSQICDRLRELQG